MRDELAGGFGISTERLVHQMEMAREGHFHFPYQLALAAFDQPYHQQQHDRTDRGYDDAAYHAVTSTNSKAAE